MKGSKHSRELRCKDSQSLLETIDAHSGAKKAMKLWTRSCRSSKTDSGCKEGGPHLRSQGSIHAILTEDPKARFYLLMIDFRAAFDTVSHEFIEKSLLHMKVPQKLVNVIMIIYREASGKVKLDGGFSPSSPIRRGVIQGDCLSPILFIISLHLILVVAQLPPFTSNKLQSLYFAYADDILVACRDLRGAQEILNSIDRAATPAGLQINPNRGKTELQQICKLTPVAALVS